MEEYIGMIKLFAGSTPPRNWAFCHGQLLSVAQHQALFSLFGTTFGGNGTTTFGLPDLRGRVPIGAGNGINLTPVSLGQASGTESVTLTASQIPPHTHSLVATDSEGNTGQPQGALFAKAVDFDVNPVNVYANSSNEVAGSKAIASTGGDQPHQNRQPFLGLNYMVCLIGAFPLRD